MQHILFSMHQHITFSSDLGFLQNSLILENVRDEEIQEVINNFCKIIEISNESNSKINQIIKRTQYFDAFYLF